MTIPEFISNQIPERQDLLGKIHEIILQEDKSVEAKVGMMMGKEMILYDSPGSFKYGLSSVKKHISLHAMPIYCSTEIHSKYKNLLPKATFQKGCVNFLDENEMPLSILTSLMTECSKIDLQAIREEYLKSKKK
jgi:hypothetical protein